MRANSNELFCRDRRTKLDGPKSIMVGLALIAEFERYFSLFYFNLQELPAVLVIKQFYLKEGSREGDEKVLSSC